MMITYVDTALPLLNDPDSGFQKEVKILTEKEYDNVKNQDSAFFDAQEIAKDNLRQMKEKAQKKKQSEALRSKLDAFRIETTANKSLVDNANAQYSKSITVNGTKYNSCIAYLDKDLDALKTAEDEVLHEKQGTGKIKDRFTKPSHWVFWAKLFPGPARGLIDKTVEDFHKDAVAKLADAKNRKARIYNSRKYIFAMSEQMKDLVPLMAAAVDALNKLALFFGSQDRNLELLIGNFERIGRGENSTVGAIRRSNINGGIKYAIENH
ncbi:hypothetical protein BJX61DRAFT_525108 [Aspergillus egyptiacus]|nr:hypothetical protein BJX61DRAFT_525108 [Aspergillus egyptiacus]